MRSSIFLQVILYSLILGATSSSSAPIPKDENSDTIPNKAKITYRGSYNSAVVVVSKRRGNIPSFRVGGVDVGRLANSIPRKETKAVSGSIVLVVNYRGDRIFGEATTTGEINAFTFTGVRYGDTCKWDDTEGWGSVSSFRCTATEFTGKKVNGPSAPQQLSIGINTIVDETEKLRAEAAAAADAMREQRRAVMTVDNEAHRGNHFDITRYRRRATRPAGRGARADAGDHRTTFGR